MTIAHGRNNHNNERMVDFMDVEKLMAETAEHYEGKMDKLFHQIQELKYRCGTLQRENKALRKQNAALIKQKKEKQHYRNGQKRGRTMNG